MSTYSKADLERIAAATGAKMAAIEFHAKRFEASAWWYRFELRYDEELRAGGERASPGRQRDRMKQVAKAARRLLKALGITDPAAAMDGPSDRDLMDLLQYPDGSTEDSVLWATERVGRLVTLLEGIEATVELERLAQTAAVEVIHLGKLLGRTGNAGDRATDGWIAAMIPIYETITGAKAGTSVHPPGHPIEGIAGGPLIRFLIAAARPLDLTYSEDAWRSRIRTVQRSVGKTDRHLAI